MTLDEFRAQSEKQRQYRRMDFAGLSIEAIRDRGGTITEMIEATGKTLEEVLAELHKLGFLHADHSSREEIRK